MILGANGSGKTTLLKAISGINKNYQGTISGVDHLKIKCSFDFIGMEPGISGIDNLNALLIKEKIDTSYLNYLIEGFRMLDNITKKVSRMSLGMKRKTSLIAALAPKPDLLILDEPLNGLDEIAQQFFLNSILNDISNSQKIIIASHFSPVFSNLSHLQIIRL